MPAKTISNILNSTPFNSDSILSSLMLGADQRTDCILYVGNIIGRKVEYISPLCQEKLGYSPSDFTIGGPDFIYKITDQRFLPSIINQQVAFVKQAKAPGFDAREVIIQRFPTAFVTPHYGHRKFVCIGVVLTYTDVADPEYFIGLIAEPNDQTVGECTSLLREVKERHNAIFRHPVFTNDERTFDLVYATGGRQDATITRREVEVLELLSKGFSTKEIADILGISFHTTEGYRKNLLQKFEAKNSAELIKKASKVFWLE